MLTESADDINTVGGLTSMLWQALACVRSAGLADSLSSHVRDPQTVTYISNDFSQDILIILSVS